MRLSNRIAKWIKRQVKFANKKGVVLGLSGGVDSAVVAVLCKMALGKNNVLGLLLPCESRTDDEKSAFDLAGKFDIKTKKLEIDNIYNSFIKTLPRGNHMAYANLKPRLRMCALYYFAQKLNYLVAGTGNKSELVVGYFTKYGDGGVDILPLVGLLKTEVRQLAKELKIPREIIEKTPSAGLWHGQTDEGEMGITYEELDRIIVAIGRKKIKGISKAKLSKVKKMMRGSLHKRAPIPVFEK